MPRQCCHPALTAAGHRRDPNSALAAQCPISATGPGAHHGSNGDLGLMRKGWIFGCPRSRKGAIATAPILPPHRAVCTCANSSRGSGGSAPGHRGHANCAERLHHANSPGSQRPAGVTMEGVCNLRTGRDSAIRGNAPICRGIGALRPVRFRAEALHARSDPARRKPPQTRPRKNSVIRNRDGTGPAPASARSAAQCVQEPRRSVAKFSP